MERNKKYLVTGGAGFIGAHFVRSLVDRLDADILVLDKLTEASDYERIKKFVDDGRVSFQKVDIANRDMIFDLIYQFAPEKIVHFAAESHVDTSLRDPHSFIESNVVGTVNMLDAAVKMLGGDQAPNINEFRFHYISTDEIFGDLPLKLGSQKEVAFYNDKFVESSPLKPSSPYSASKAASFLFVKAWEKSFGLPVSSSHCSNNYGPNQHKEKLVPKIISHALCGKEIGIYGTGQNVRDWLFVGDHVQAVNAIIDNGSPGCVYNIGGGCELSNQTLVRKLCSILDEKWPTEDNPNVKELDSYSDLIRYVEDRKGHDMRYAIDYSKIKRELGWFPSTPFEHGLGITVDYEIKKHIDTDLGAN